MDKKRALEDIDEIIVIPYCHTDFAWTNTRDWHICRYIKSIERALDIMGENPDFTYGVDNVVHSLAVFMENKPERVKELRQRVREKRFYAANGGYSLARPDYIGDEVYLRNLIEGKRTLSELLEPEDEIDFFFNADTACGHSQMPQILRLSGHSYYMFLRPFEGLSYKKIPKQFRWMGLDGSEVIVNRGDYGGFIHGEYINGMADWEKTKKLYLKNDLGALLHLCASKTVAQFYGGDDFIPFNTVYDKPLSLLEFIAEWNSKERVKMRFGTPGDFFHALEEEALPRVCGVLDPGELSFNAPAKGNGSFWRKRLEANRLLPRLETLCVMAESLGISYPEEHIKALWLSVFEFTGHALEFILEEDHKKLFALAQRAVLEAGELLCSTAEAISKALARGDESENVIINTCPFERTETVTLRLSSAFGIGNAKLRDRFGNAVELQQTRRFLGDKTPDYASSVEVEARVFLPACSYNAVYICENTPSAPEKPVCTAEGGSAVFDGGIFAARFENSVLRSLTPAGENEIAGFDGGLFHLEFIKTAPSGGWLASWDAVERFEFAPSEFKLIKNGPLIWEAAAEGILGPHFARVVFSARKGEPRLNVRVKISSDGTPGYFTAGFDCGDEPDIHADIPFGIEKRDLSGEKNQTGEPGADSFPDFEQAVPGMFFASTFAAFKNGPAPLALISGDCSIYYRHDKKRKRVSLVLNRNINRDGDLPAMESWFLKASPDFAGRGEHEYSFALMVRARTSGFIDVIRESERMRRPPEVCRVFNRSGAELPPVLEVIRGSVAVTAVYRENGSHIIRFYKASGRESAAELKINIPCSKITKADLLGRPLETVAPDANGIVRLLVRPWEIVNLCLSD